MEPVGAAVTSNARESTNQCHPACHPDRTERTAPPGTTTRRPRRPATGVRGPQELGQPSLEGAERLAEFVERRLDGLDLAAVLIDGIAFQDYLFVVALGVDSTGAKEILGMWQGATENTEVCKELLQDLVARGLPADRRYLFVLDGSKALAKAVRSCFGKNAVIQRWRRRRRSRGTPYFLQESGQPAMRMQSTPPTGGSPVRKR